MATSLINVDQLWANSGHYPHLVHPRWFVERVQAFELSLA